MSEESWKEANASFGVAALKQSYKAWNAAPTEAERERAAIVAWLRGPALSAWGADCSGDSETTFYANAIERGEHLR